MLKNRKKIKIIICSILLLSLAVFLSVGISQGIRINNDKFQVTANQFEIKSIAEVSEDTAKNSEFNGNEMIALVSTNIKNISEQNEYLGITSFKLTSKGWANSLSLELFMKLNPDYNSSLDSGKDINVVIPYIMYKNQFNLKDWESIKNLDYYMIFEVYPQKTYINLHI